MIKIILRDYKISLLIFFLLILSMIAMISSIYLQLKAATILINNSFLIVDFLLFQIGSMVFMVIGELIKIFASFFIKKQKNNLLIHKKIAILNYFDNISYKKFQRKSQTEYVYDLESNLTNYFNEFIENFYNMIHGIILLISLFIFIIVEAFLISFWILIIFVFVFLSVFLFGIIPLISSRILFKINNQTLNKRNKFLGKITNFLENYHFFFWANKIDNFTKVVVHNLISIQNIYLKKWKKTIFFDELEEFSSSFSNQLALIVVSFIVSLNPLNAIFLITLESIFSNFRDNGRQTISIFKNNKVIKPMYDSLKKYNLNNKSNLLSDLNKPINKIQFNNIDFKYGSKTIFHNFNQSFLFTKKYAMIGSSGSGKSTLIKLLLKEERFLKGQIFFNNQAIDKINQKTILNQIYLITNKLVNVNSDLIKNITLNDTNINNEKLINACKLAKINFDLKEDWENLSDGQKQKIEIARAFYLEKPIIIFDEALSYIDAKTALLIENNLLAMKKLLFINISHHFSKKQLSKYDYVIDLNTNKTC